MQCFFALTSKDLQVGIMPHKGDLTRSGRIIAAGSELFFFCRSLLVFTLHGVHSFISLL